MSVVRVSTPDTQPKQYEQSASCHECGTDILVMPPKKIRNKIDKGVETDDMALIEAGLEWSLENYFFCPKCQKEYDYSEME